MVIRSAPEPKNPSKFASILKTYVIDTISKIVPNIFNLSAKTFAELFAKHLAMNIAMDKAKNLLLKTFNVHSWIAKLTSVGDVAAYIFSIIDGYNNNSYVVIKVRR